MDHPHLELISTLKDAAERWKDAVEEVQEALSELSELNLIDLPDYVRNIDTGYGSFMKVIKAVIALEPDLNPPEELQALLENLLEQCEQAAQWADEEDDEE